MVWYYNNFAGIEIITKNIKSKQWWSFICWRELIWWVL